LIKEISGIDAVHALAAGHWHDEVDVCQFKDQQSYATEPEEFFHWGEVRKSTRHYRLSFVYLSMDSHIFYHGTKADLKAGDLIAPGFNSNYGSMKKASYVYLTATLDAATWGAELAVGEGRGRIYIVEPTGPIEDDPNLTDKKFPGNPTKSYRTKDPLRVIGELSEWQGHAPAQLKAMRDHLQKLKEQGIEAIED